MTDPPLTTVASDREALCGRRAVDMALDPDLDTATPGATDRTRRFPSRLLVRTSCGCPNPPATSRSTATQVPTATD